MKRFALLIWPLLVLQLVLAPVLPAAVPVATPEVVYTASGGATSYAYLFRIYAATDLKVSVAGVLKTYGADYSVTGVNNPAGGTVVFGVAPADGAQVKITRAVPLDRATDYTPGGPLTAATLNKDFDRIVSQVQDTDFRQEQKGARITTLETEMDQAQADLLEHRADIDQAQAEVDAAEVSISTNAGILSRALKFPEGDSTSATLPDVYSRGGKLLGFNAAGAPITISNQIGTFAADITVENIAALRTLPAPAASNTIALVLGYYTPGDGGGGPARVWKSGAAPGTYVDNGGSIIVPNGGNGSAAWVWEWSGAINIRWFGAVPGGSAGADNTPAIQAALNAVSNGGSVYFPKSGGGAGTGPSYRIDTGLTLSKNDVTLFSDASSEYSEGLVTSNAITMLTITGYGTRIQGVGFTGDGSSTVFGTASGVVIDRSSLGDAETYSNLDTRIEDCLFFRLNDAVRGKGRNVFVINNTFSECKRGVVGELHTYSAGTVSDFRGWRISRNRFHSCGGPYIKAGSAEALPADLSALDSWCIQMPQTSGSTSHLEIFNNNADFCGAGFYKGYLAGAKIIGNQTHGGTAIFVYAYITDSANQTQSSNFVNVIENNSINSRTADQTTDRGYQFSLNSIVAFGVSNLVIERNVMHNAAQSHILVTACTRASVRNNLCSNGNMLFVEDATTRPCIFVDQSSNVACTDNKMWSTIGTVYSEGIKATTCSGLKLRDNTVLNATTPITASASDLVNAADEGLTWQTPAMLNSFVLGARSRGYRRLFNGTVAIDIEVSSGTDNTAAFTLPAGYRPSVAILLPAVSVWTDGSDAYCQIETNGNVIVNWNSTPAASYHIRHTFQVQ